MYSIASHPKDILTSAYCTLVHSFPCLQGGKVIWDEEKGFSPDGRMVEALYYADHTAHFLRMAA